MSGTQNDGLHKLALILKPLLDECMKEMKTQIIASSQEILLEVNRNGAKIDVLEKIAASKKTTTRAEKKPTTTGTGETTATDDSAPQINAVAKTFPTNRLVWFREHYKTEPDFRAKYVTDDVKKLMETNATISGKTNESQRHIAEATFCWNYIKNTPETVDLIEKDYQASKNAHEASIKPAQLGVEERTPPN